MWTLINLVFSHKNQYQTKQDVHLIIQYTESWNILIG